MISHRSCHCCSIWICHEITHLYKCWSIDLLLYLRLSLLLINLLRCSLLYYLMFSRWKICGQRVILNHQVSIRCRQLRDRCWKKISLILFTIRQFFRKRCCIYLVNRRKRSFDGTITVDLLLTILIYFELIRFCFVVFISVLSLSWVCAKTLWVTTENYWVLVLPLLRKRHFIQDFVIVFCGWISCNYPSCKNKILFCSMCFYV